MADVCPWQNSRSWPNCPAYSKNDVWPKSLLNTCENKGQWSADWCILIRIFFLVSYFHKFYQKCSVILGYFIYKIHNFISHFEKRSVYDWMTDNNYIPATPSKVPSYGAWSIKDEFYYLIDTRLLVLRVNCYSDVQKCPQKHWHWIDFPAIFAALHINTRSNFWLNLLMNKRFDDLKKRWFLRPATLSGWPFWRLWLYFH